MLKAIYEIGKNITGDSHTLDTFIENICLKLNEKDFSGNKQHIVFLNFNTETKKIEIDFEEINARGSDTGKEYVWIGNQIRHKLTCPVTTKKIDKLLSNSLNELKDHKAFAESYIDNILEIFFENGKIKSDKFDFFTKKREKIDKEVKEIIKKINEVNQKKEVLEKIKEIKSLWEDAAGDKLKVNTKGDVNKIKNEILEKLTELEDNTDSFLATKYQKSELLIKDLIEFKLKLEYNKKPTTRSPSISLYTIKINGENIAKRSEYKNFIYREKIAAAFKNNKFIKTTTCNVCLKDRKTTSNFSGLTFNYYITDKRGFSSNLDNVFTKNFNICEECYQKLLISERFIKENFGIKIGGINSFILPAFTFPQYNFDYKEFSVFIRNKVENISDLNKAESELKDYLMYEDENNSYLINFLFYHSPAGRNEFKILKLIKDIPPTRINFIKSEENNLKILVDNKFEETNNFYIDLKKIWNCLPIKCDKKDEKIDNKCKQYTAVSKYLNILDNIFSDKPVKYSSLIVELLKTIHIIKYENSNYNIYEKQDFTNKILQMNFLLLFIKNLKLLGGQFMDTKENVSAKELIPDEIQDYWNSIKIYENNAKKALFLIGYLMGEIGSKQQSKDMKNKPILNKINFQGIGKEKLIRLTGDIFEKLRQNKILDYNEDIYSAAKIFMDETINNWNLSNQENVFYILSGYAFSNYLMRKRSKVNYNSELKQKIEFIEKLKKENKNTEEFEKLLREAKEKAAEKHYYEARNILNSIK